MRQSSKTAWVKSQPERSASEKSTPMSRCLRKLLWAMEAKKKLTRSMVAPSMLVFPKVTARKRKPVRSAPKRLAPSKLQREKSHPVRRDRFILAFWNFADAQLESAKWDSMMSEWSKRARWRSQCEIWSSPQTTCENSASWGRAVRHIERVGTQTDEGAAVAPPAASPRRDRARKAFLCARLHAPSAGARLSRSRHRARS